MNNILVNSSNIKKNNIIKDNNLYIVRLDNYFDDINIKVLENINSHIIVIGNNIGSNINIDLGKNTNLKIDSFCVNNNSKITVNLNEENSNIKMVNSIISTIDNTLFISIKHNFLKTNSFIINNGFTFSNSKIVFDINGYICKNSSECKCNQENKIISKNTKSSKILPNLYIDNYDVEANHSAYIGDVSEEELFYLMSRGIKKEEAYKLLIKAFLIGKLDIDEELKEELLLKISEYVRKED